jgi:hypothetical protein
MAPWQDSAHRLRTRGGKDDGCRRPGIRLGRPWTRGLPKVPSVLRIPRAEDMVCLLAHFPIPCTEAP